MSKKIIIQLWFREYHTLTKWTNITLKKSRKKTTNEDLTEVEA